MSREAIKLALEALEFDGFTPEDVTHRGYTTKAITALREALAEQPAQQEPVFSFQMQLKPGWGGQYPAPCVIGEPDLCSLFGKVGDVVTFYTSPQPAQQEPVNQRAHEMALRQWDHWEQYALELQEKLVKYEGGAPMVLNTSPPTLSPAQQEPVAYLVNCTSCGEEKKVERGNHHPWCFCGSDSFDWGNSRDVPAQRTWFGLSDEEVLGLFGRFTAMTGKGWLDLYRMAETKLKEKNQ